MDYTSIKSMMQKELQIDLTTVCILRPMPGTYCEYCSLFKGHTLPKKSPENVIDSSRSVRTQFLSYFS